MKNIVFLLLATIISIPSDFAQTVNWSDTEDHILNFNAGLDYSVSYGIGYGYKLKTTLPILLNLELSSASGENVLDDYKIKIGGQANLVRVSHFLFNVRLQSVFRRYENSFARLVDFGSDFAGTFGYYRKHWFVASEFGFDKAIVTHFKHTDQYREYFPEAINGWYEPSTGGNFYYGLQSGLGVGHIDLYAKAGKLITQDFKTAPFLPFYFQMGINFKFHKLVYKPGE